MLCCWLKSDWSCSAFNAAARSSRSFMRLSAFSLSVRSRSALSLSAFSFTFKQTWCQGNSIKTNADCCSLVSNSIYRAMSSRRPDLYP